MHKNKIKNRLAEISLSAKRFFFLCIIPYLLLTLNHFLFHPYGRLSL